VFVYPVIHFISPGCDNPVFNGIKLLDQFYLTGFSLAEAFSVFNMEDISDRPVLLRRALEMIDDRIKSGDSIVRSFFDDPNNNFPFALRNLIRKSDKNAILEEVMSSVRDYATKYICEQMSLDRIGLHLSPQVKSGITPMEDDTEHEGVSRHEGESMRFFSEKPQILSGEPANDPVFHNDRRNKGNV